MSLILDTEGSIARITLDRADKHNALDRAAWVALREAIVRFDNSPQVRVIVIAANGGRAFCSGADISEFEAAYATQEAAEDYGAAISGALEAVAACTKPVIAQIDGVCVGGGCALAMACDLRYASDRSRFAITPVRIGAAYSYGDTRRLVSLVGPGRAKEILFFADFLSAAEAQEAGLINQAVPVEALPDLVAGRAARLARGSRNALRVAKMVVNAVAAPEPAALGQISEEIGAIFTSSDFREGYSAFLGKRAPEFT